jgi:phosphoenolpyruvate carboxylase
MNTLKTVYSKLFKEETTNLASHEVELSLIEDFTSAKSTATSLINEILQKDYPNLVKNTNDAKDKMRKAINLVTKLSNMNSGLDIKFKELGLDWRKDANYKGFNELLKNEKTVFDILNKLK